MSTWNKKNFSIYTSDERSALGLIEELGDQTNYNTEELERVKESDNKKVSHDEMNNIYKIDKNADFTGSWHGIKKPTASQEGLQATVDKIVEEDIPSINEQLDTIVKYIPKANENIVTEINSLLRTYREITLSPNVEYLIDDSIVIPSMCKINGNGATIKMKEDVNKPILIDDGWNGNGATREIVIEDLRLRGNGLSENYGIIMQTYYTTLRNIVIYNTGRDGVRITESNKNGNVTTGTLVENRIENIRLTNCGGYGIYCGSNGNNKVTDGFIKDILSYGVGEQHLYIGSLAGWKIDGVHTYGATPKTAISLNNWYNSNVSNIYIEGFGEGKGLSIGASQQNIALNNIDIICNGENKKAIQVGKSSFKSSVDVLINNLKFNGGATNSVGVNCEWGVNVKIGNYSISSTLTDFTLVKGDGSNTFIYNDISPVKYTYVTMEGYKFPVYKSVEYVNGGTKVFRVLCAVSDGKSVNFDINFNGTKWGQTPLVNVALEKCMVSRKGTSYYLGKTTLSGSSITTLTYDTATNEIVISLALANSTTGKLDVVIYP